MEIDYDPLDINISINLNIYISVSNINYERGYI